MAQAEQQARKEAEEELDLASRLFSTQSNEALPPLLQPVVVDGVPAIDLATWEAEDDQGWITADEADDPSRQARRERRKRRKEQSQQRRGYSGRGAARSGAGGDPADDEDDDFFDVATSGHGRGLFGRRGSASRHGPVGISLLLGA